jgi:hypothetical protein
MKTARRRLAMPLLLILLVASLAGNIILYPRATRPLFSEGDRPLIQRTIAAAASSGEHEEQMRTLFPVVMHLADRSCVELRSRYERGHYGACYNSRTGELLDQTASVSHPPQSLREIVEEYMIGLVGWP